MKQGVNKYCREDPASAHNIFDRDGCDYAKSCANCPYVVCYEELSTSIRGRMQNWSKRERIEFLKSVYQAIIKPLHPKIKENLGLE
jgi:hypothetical protein